MKMIFDNPFKSFWMAGYESTDQLNVRGERVDFLHITSHFKLLKEDYEDISQFGLRVVREGLRWSQVETSPYIYDFSIVGLMIEEGKRQEIQQVWDLCHFGFPDDLSPLHPQFAKRFESLCSAFAEFWKGLNLDEPLIVTPINEVSFMSWLGGDVAATSPFCVHNGWNVKYGYMRAYILGIKAIRDIVAGARILTTEPLISVAFADGATEEQKQHARNHHELQYQVLDMLSGRICPELGGKEDYLDILGCNFYYDNQWIQEPYAVLGWNDPVPDPRYRPLSDLVLEVYKRYDRPIILSETSHPGIDRPVWIERLGNEVGKLLQQHIPFWGICLYPIIDRPDWDDLGLWHHSGIWDRFSDAPDDQRILHEPSIKMLLHQQDYLGQLVNREKEQKYCQTTYNRFKSYGY